MFQCMFAFGFVCLLSCDCTEQTHDQGKAETFLRGGEKGSEEIHFLFILRETEHCFYKFVGMRAVNTWRCYKTSFFCFFPDG